MVSTQDKAFVLDIAGGSLDARANVQLYGSNDTFAQKYHLRAQGNGLYSIQEVLSGKVLDVAGGSVEAGANVQQYNDNGTLAQLWYLQPSGKSFLIRSAKSGLALNIAGGQLEERANIEVQKADKRKSEVFSLKPVPVIANDGYVFSSTLVAPLVLDLDCGLTTNGANIRLWRSNGAIAQDFEVVHAGGGKYTIRCKASGLYLGVENGSASDGANVRQWASDGTDAQRWTVETCDAGGLMFKNVDTGKYLDVAGGRKFAGTNVQQLSGTGTARQAFVLRPAGWYFYSDASADALRYIQKAEEYQGWPYHWGGRSPETSFDCSGLVMYCANATLGTNYDLMYTSAEILSTLCTIIPAAQAVAGDLVFYRGTYGHINKISHVVIYCGQGVMYGAGNPIGYNRVDVITNMDKQPAQYFYARIRR